MHRKRSFGESRFYDFLGSGLVSFKRDDRDRALPETRKALGAVPRNASSISGDRGRGSRGGFAFWAILGHSGPFWAFSVLPGPFWPFWVISVFFVIFDDFGSFWSFCDFWVILGHSGPFWAIPVLFCPSGTFLAILGHFGLF